MADLEVDIGKGSLEITREDSGSEEFFCQRIPKEEKIVHKFDDSVNKWIKV